MPNIRIATKPIVLIWQGTCEITKKSGNLIELCANSHEKIDQIIVKYRYLKSDIQRNNRHAEVIFLACPYYSIVEWNRRKGCSDLSLYTNQDSELCSLIDYYNKKVATLNSIEHQIFLRTLLGLQKRNRLLGSNTPKISVYIQTVFIQEIIFHYSGFITY